MKTKSNFERIVGVIISLLSVVFFFSFVFYEVYFRMIGVFGCFDQCFNYVAGFFLGQGRHLYSEIFFNHQVLMAYLSFLIQQLTRPQTLYQLVLYHRVFVFLYSLIWDILLSKRFRLKGVGFVIFYELTKYYFFGHFFLPEGLLVYPVVYLFGLWWEGDKSRLSRPDYLAAAVFTWLAIFLREVYIPLAFCLYCLILLQGKFNQVKKLSVGVFFLLTCLTLLFLPLKEYFFQVFKLNLLTTASAEIREQGLGGLGSLKIFLYPFSLLYGGKWNNLRQYLFGVDLVFLTSVFYFVWSTKKIKQTFLLFFLLGLAAVRWVVPGTVYYEAFHLLSWYALFLMAVFFLLFDFLKKKAKGLFRIFLCVLPLCLIFLLLSPISYLKGKNNRVEEFTVNYAQYYTYGQAIKTLAAPSDTLFLDLWDDLIYYQAGILPAYPYALYTPVMSDFPLYNNLREKMFLTDPPDFYYAYCNDTSVLSSPLPKKVMDQYLSLNLNGKRSCLYVKKNKLKSIPSSKWEEISTLGFSANFGL